ncbi:MAG: hypothetical protein QOE71_2325 [Pseudonocardiales bacterium]|jgi:hypothetical protein|nr:hypothetical protein [Pseudonocardiales bacterium]MDQ1751269.1 hypothetical protein [Pseudonocardiales bacterium]
MSRPNCGFPATPVRIQAGRMAICSVVPAVTMSEWFLEAINRRQNITEDDGGAMRKPTRLPPDSRVGQA